MTSDQIGNGIATTAADNGTGAYGIIEYIARNTDSVLLLALIIVVLGILVLVPIYLRSQKEIRKGENSDKRILIDVVQENTKAITDLRSTLEYNNLAMESSLKSIRDDANQTNKSIIAIEHAINNLTQDTCVVTSNIASMMTNQATHMKALDVVRETTSDIKDASLDILKVVERPPMLEMPQKLDTVVSNLQTLCDAQSANCDKLGDLDDKVSKALKKPVVQKSTASKETK